MHVYVSVLLICPFVSWKCRLLTHNGEEVRSERLGKVPEMEVLQHSQLIDHGTTARKLRTGNTRRIMRIPKRRVILICGVEDITPLKEKTKHLRQPVLLFRTTANEVPV
jgi:hypothetical protein